MKFHVPDMSCGHCVAAITTSLQAADQDATVETDLATREVSVDTTLDAAAVMQVLDRAGYPAALR